MASALGVSKHRRATHPTPPIIPDKLVGAQHGSRSPGVHERMGEQVASTVKQFGKKCYTNAVHLQHKTFLASVNKRRFLSQPWSFFLLSFYFQENVCLPAFVRCTAVPYKKATQVKARLFCIDSLFPAVSLCGSPRHLRHTQNWGNRLSAVHSAPLCRKVCSPAPVRSMGVTSPSSLIDQLSLGPKVKAHVSTGSPRRTSRYTATQQKLSEGSGEIILSTIKRSAKLK